MKVLIINAGSSSLKFKLYNMADDTVIAEGNCQRVGLSDSEIRYKNASGVKETFVENLPSHRAALRRVLALLCEGETAVIASIKEIDAAGHRVSMGGDRYAETVLVDESVIETVDELSEITPLHNPPQLKCILACRELFGENFPMTVGFDTAFHHSIPQRAFTYGIPYEYYEKYSLRRYGFHGLSYQFVVERYNELTGGGSAGEKLVACHLGGGASVSPIVGGVSMDNTFGFGTGQGPVCGSRAGTFDHVAIGYLMKKTGMDYQQIEEMLHREGGILGISGISSDEKELEDAVMAGSERAKLALEVMAYQIRQYIGGYAFSMGGLDSIIFTGGIGENSDYMRAEICANLEPFGIVLDGSANVEHNRTEHLISTPDSKVKVWIIPTNEELVIARDTMRILTKNTESVH